MPNITFHDAPIEIRLLIWSHLPTPGSRAAAAQTCKAHRVELEPFLFSSLELWSEGAVKICNDALLRRPGRRNYVRHIGIFHPFSFLDEQIAGYPDLHLRLRGPFRNLTTFTVEVPGGEEVIARAYGPSVTHDQISHRICASARVNGVSNLFEGVLFQPGRGLGLSAPLRHCKLSVVCFFSPGLC